MRALTYSAFFLLLAAAPLGAMEHTMSAMAPSMMGVMCPMCHAPAPGTAASATAAPDKSAAGCAMTCAATPAPAPKKTFGKDAPGFKTGNK